MKYDQRELIEMYEAMVTGRLYDETIVRESNKGKLLGMFHLGFYQEATGAAIVTAMGPHDMLMPGHRMHTANLFLMDMKRFTAEMAGRYAGYSKGIGADFHCFSLEERLFPIYSLLGGGFSHAAGYAHGMKANKKGGVMIAVVGDGGFQPGGNYEAMNMALLQKLPIVFVVENNFYSMSTPIEVHSAHPDLAKRAEGFGVPSKVVEDGADVVKVREAVEEAISSARNFQPFLLEIRTYRKAGHYYGDQREYVNEEIEMTREKKFGDPIERFEQELLKEQVLSEASILETKKRIQQKIDDAFAFAYESRKTTPEDALNLNLVYANVEGDLA